jgi:adenylate cyclase
LTLLPAVLDLDEQTGLWVLFSLRGAQAPPEGVVVVSVSRESAAGVGQTNQLDEWPRSLHAQLIHALAEARVEVVVFDVLFDKSREPRENDDRLAASIAAAGNVLLFEGVRPEEVDGERLDRRVPPLPMFQDAALATAPFVLPRVPIRVAQFWTFGRGAPDVPSLPSVALQVTSLPAYTELVAALQEVRPDAAERMPASSYALLEDRSIVAGMTELRRLFREDRSLAAQLYPRLRTDAARRLVDLYSGPDGRYINYFGPPQSIRTLPYDLVLNDAQNLDLAGKVLFVGFSESSQSEEQDWFHSVFSQRSGAVMSGVEIGATAFANLRDGRTLRALSMPRHLLLVLLWGILLGTLLGVLPIGRGLAVAMLLGALYVLVAYESFADRLLWLPLLVPLAVQLPLGMAGGFLSRYRELKDQRERVQTVLGYYAPPHVVRRLAEESVSLEADKQLVHGTCLFTDAEEYTTISEALHPDDLRKLMNEYYQVMFAAVTRHGGHISDTAGDSMVAVWTTAEPDAASRARACRAAGEILDALADFNRHRGRQQLPTRIGLESGQLLLGNVGAGQHFEYRAIGDIVNTASRLQGLNRVLGTRVLISAATLAGTGLQARDLGVFLLRGKTTPLRVYEPVLGSGGVDRQLVEPFAEALACVHREAWPEARQRFARLVASYPADGPAAFYDALMTDYERRPPTDWRGYVSVNAK